MVLLLTASARRYNDLVGFDSETSDDSRTAIVDGSAEGIPQASSTEGHPHMVKTSNISPFGEVTTDPIAEI